MSRIALTLWFTITTLLGPGVCCCTFAGTSTADPQPAPAAQPAPVSKPAKSCCQHGEEPAPCGEPGKPSPSREKHCPCERGKDIRCLPANEKIDSLSAQVKVLTECLADLSVPFGLDVVATTLTGSTPPLASPLSGRDLLAAYSLLRC